MPDHGLAPTTLTPAQRLSRIIEFGVGRMPTPVAARLDMLRPSLRSSLGGPMNGQLRRQEMVRQLIRTIPFAATIETGTFRGSTTEFFLHLTDGPVFTVESDPRCWLYAKKRLAPYAMADVRYADSRVGLVQLRSEPDVPKDRVLFYLDAHWTQDLPLNEELEIILAGWHDPVIIIDDFAVEGDAGYGADDYGPGQRLGLQYLKPEVLAAFEPLFPSARSEEETASRRGCVVLLPHGLAGHRPALTALRPVAPSP
jgi:predicted O-methyltransferase YrrM